MVGSFCALLELIKLGVATVEPGPGGETDDPIVSICAGATSDVSELLNAVRFDDEVVPEDPDGAPSEDSAEESTRETAAPE
jgi:hypothetical protein